MWPMTLIPHPDLCIIKQHTCSGTCHMYPLTSTLTPAVMSWGVLSNVPKWQKMSSCQKDVKYQKMQHLDYGRGSQKINWHNDVHRHWHQFWCHICWSLKTVKFIHRKYFWPIWWPSYVTSKLMSISVNLIMSIYFLWTSSIVQIFDFLTSFWHFDTDIELKPFQPITGLFFIKCVDIKGTGTYKQMENLSTVLYVDFWSYKLFWKRENFKTILTCCC